MEVLPSPPGSQPPETADGPPRRAAVVLLLVLLVVAVYAPTLSHGFVWDDQEQIVNNPHLRRAETFVELWRQDVLSLSRGDGNRSNYYRPLFYLQYMVYFRLFGLNAGAWHALAILHHLLATLAVVVLLRRLGWGLEMAVAAAALFAVHPAHGESVSWVAAAFNDPPAATCLLLGLAAHVAWRQRGGAGLLALGVLGYGLALGLKESALSMLLLVPLVEVFMQPRPRWLRGAARYLPLALPFGACLACELAVTRLGALGRWWLEHPALALGLQLGVVLVPAAWLYRWWDRRHPPAEGWRTFTGYAPYLVVTLGYLYLRKVTILTALGVYAGTPGWSEVLPTLPVLGAVYLRLLLWPWGLSPSYPTRFAEGWSDPVVLASLALLAVVAAAVAWWGRRRPVVIFGALWLLACLAPAFNVRSFRATYLVHQRYLYLGCLGLCLIVVWTLWTQVAVRRRRWLLCGALLVVWAASNLYHNRFWASDTALWTRVAEVDPHNPAAFDWLGAQALEQGRLDEAEALFQGALGADPESPFGYRNLALLWHLRRHQPAAALPFYDRAIELFRQLPEHRQLYLGTRLNRGACLAELGRRQEALEVFLELAEQPPQLSEAARNAAVLLRQGGDPEAAAGVLRRALARHPEDGQLRAMLADLERAAAGDGRQGAGASVP